MKNSGLKKYSALFFILLTGSSTGGAQSFEGVGSAVGKTLRSRAPGPEAYLNQLIQGRRSVEGTTLNPELQYRAVDHLTKVVAGRKKGSVSLLVMAADQEGRVIVAAEAARVHELSTSTSFTDGAEFSMFPSLAFSNKLPGGSVWEVVTAVEGIDSGAVIQPAEIAELKKAVTSHNRTYFTKLEDRLGPAALSRKSAALGWGRPIGGFTDFIIGSASLAPFRLPRLDSNGFTAASVSGVTVSPFHALWLMSMVLTGKTSRLQLLEQNSWYQKAQELDGFTLTEGEEARSWGFSPNDLSWHNQTAASQKALAVIREGLAAGSKSAPQGYRRSGAFSRRFGQFRGQPTKDDRAVVTWFLGGVKKNGKTITIIAVSVSEKAGSAKERAATLAGVLEAIFPK